MSKIIVVSEDGVFTNRPISIPEVADLFCASLTGMVQQAHDKYKDDEDAEKIDKELFDFLNYSFSKCLENSFPTLELRPELTEEAIKAMEDKILAEKVAEVNASQNVGDPTEKIIDLQAFKKHENSTRE